ncbi:MAG: zinc ribbon domain-containing protein [Deltaproteobacteria bacterium]|nr:zinc ribbon domain-containing protein [Deltaproteobacteria bacterium]
MGNNFSISFMFNLLLLAEIILPIILIIVLGFFAWRLIRRKWIDRIFAKLVYEKNPFVREFYEQVGRPLEEKGNKVVRPLAYIAVILCIALIFKVLWPYVFYESHSANLLLEGGLPLVFLYMGLILMGFGGSGSVISSLLFIKETKKFRVYSRSIEIYLLSKYFENILYMALGIGLIVGTAFLWFSLLKMSVPVFTYLENQFTSFGEPRVSFEEILKVWGILLTSFRDRFETLCVISFLITMAGLTVPYMWFKGKRFAKIFLALFFSGTGFSYLVSFLIEKLVTSDLTWIFVAVWTFSALITYIVFHLIDTIWVNKIGICRYCQAENSIDSNYCSECGHKLILLPKESRARV